MVELVTLEGGDVEAEAVTANALHKTVSAAEHKADALLLARQTATTLDSEDLVPANNRKVDEAVV